MIKIKTYKNDSTCESESKNKELETALLNYFVPLQSKEELTLNRENLHITKLVLIELKKKSQNKLLVQRKDNLLDAVIGLETMIHKIEDNETITLEII